MMNQQYNPLDPEIGPTADQMLQSYRDRAAALRGEQQQQIPQSFNPYQPENNQEDTQGQHTANMEQWLSPVKQDVYDNQSAYTDDKHDNFLTNLEKDPAVKEYGEQAEAYMNSLLAAVQAGQIDQQQAQDMAQDYFNNVVKPIITKHHSKDSKANKLHRKQEPEIPDIVKKVRGVK
ncbi:hypothetical protein FNU33_22385 [Salmonella enterica]|nr:hypothetical protein [Salmonella enterica]ECD9309419.1 hypothetical protein [Salmonella enterica]